MLRVERRRSGVDEDISVGMQACSSVAGSRLGETVKEGRRERQGYIERGADEMGVTMRRVRIMSSGARRIAAIAVAATATPRDVSGLGLSMMSSPPMPVAAVPNRPGSGTLSTAEIKLRNQPSVVLSRKLYMKVQFVPFQTPHADSFCHSWAITSRRESGRFRSSLRTVDGGGRVGVEERESERLRSCRRCFRGDCDREVCCE